MNAELLNALERIEREKGISKQILIEAVESALVSAARKAIGDPNLAKEDVSVTMDQITGKISVYSDGVEIKSEKFGRIAAQTAKQVIIQKIREAERDVVYGKYMTRIGTIISGSVHRFDKGNILVELDDTEAVLPRSEQIPRERFRQGEGVRAYLTNVDRSANGLQIVLSRTAPGFVKKLFELEVPEISQGIVEIKSIAREAGDRTKIAVYSKDEKVDPVGACVGMRGARVRDIVKELHGERIDIVRWSDDVRDYLKAAISPAETLGMTIDREANTVTVSVPQDQLALLIGKKGRNIRLASKLVGWELIAEQIVEVIPVPIDEIDGISAKAKQVLLAAGHDDAAKIMQSGVEGLVELDGVGEKTAEKIIAACEVAVTKASENEVAAAKEAAAEAAAEKKEEEAGEEAEAIPEEVEAPEEVAEESEEEEAVDKIAEEGTAEDAAEAESDEEPEEENQQEEK